MNQAAEIMFVEKAMNPEFQDGTLALFMLVCRVGEYFCSACARGDCACCAAVGRNGDRCFCAAREHSIRQAATEAFVHGTSILAGLVKE